MKRFILLINLTLIFIFNGFSEQIILLEDLNIYGGKTFERVYNKHEQKSLMYSKLIQYFDSQNIISKGIVINTDTVARNTGIKEQIQYYKNGKIIRYEMLFNDEHKNRHGFNRLIEEVDQNDLVLRTIWYNNDTILDTFEGNADKFQFYDIEYLESEYFEGYQPNDKGDVISLSAKYFSIKSVVRFDTFLIDLDENDIKLMQIFSSSFNLNDISHYYSKKVKVYSENRSYWLYVQTDLEQYILGQKATIKYYPIGKNKEMYLICIGFYDIS